MHDLAIVKLQEILKLVPESDKVRFYLGAVYEEDKNSKDKSISNLFKNYKRTETNHLLTMERQKKIKSLENKLEKLEKQKADIFNHFNENPINYKPEKIAELEEVKKQIDEAEAQWLAMME